jgi:O-antigen/teichoic acid export membrane protein
MAKIFFKLLSLFKQKFVKDMSWTLSATIFVGFSGLILQTIIAGKYAASGLGLYAQVIAIFTLFTLLSGFGIELSTIKHTAEFHDNFEELKASFSSSQFLILIFSAIFASGLYFSSIKLPFLFSSKEVAEGIKYICPGVIFFTLNRNTNSLFNGMRRMKLYSISRTLRWSIILVLSIIIIYFSPGNINLLLFCYSISECILFFFLLYFNHKFITHKISSKWLRIHLDYGSKSIFARFINDFNSKLGIIVIGYLSSKTAVGIYSVIATFGQTILIIASSLQQNFNPFFASNYVRKNFDYIRLSISKILRILIPLSLPILIVSILGYFVYVRFFLPSEFRSTLILFSVLSVGIIFSFVFSWSVTMLPMAGFLVQNMIRIAIGAVFNLLIVIVFTYFFDLNGAVIGTSLSHIFNTALSVYFVNKYIDIDIINVIKKSFSI